MVIFYIVVKEGLSEEVTFELSPEVRGNRLCEGECKGILDR